MNNGYVIEHQCPQCGAPANLGETDRLLPCAYCRVKSYLMPGDYFRYLLPPKSGKDEELVYYPYWRYRTMVFSFTQEAIEDGVIDLSTQALASRRFPISLGVRPQAMRLRFPGADDPGGFIQPSLSISEMRDALFKRQIQNKPRHIHFRSHIGESMGLIFAPFRIDGRLTDAVSDTLIPVGDPAEPLPVTEPFSRLNWRIRFVPTLCPRCGWDLEGERDALVLTCANCRTAWTPSGGEFIRIETCHWTSQAPRTVYLPFWRISASVTGIALESYGDLIRAANLPKLTNSPGSERPLHFWAPAFKAAPGAFLRLAGNLTLSQPDFPISREIPGGSALTVNFSPKSAAGSLKTILASLLRPREEFFPILDTLQVTAKRLLLVYIPFTEGHHEWTHPDLPITVHKNLMRTSGSL